MGSVNHYKEFLFQKTAASRAKEFGVTLRTVCKWRAGDVPSLRHIKAIMKKNPRVTFLNITEYNEQKKSK